MSSTRSSSISHYHSSSWSGRSFPFHSHQSFSPSVPLPLPSTYIPEASHLVHHTPGESKLRLSLTDNSPSVARYSCLLPWPALYTTTTALFLTRNDVHISLLLSTLQWLLIGCGGKIHTFCHGRAGPVKSRPRYHFPLCLQGSSQVLFFFQLTQLISVSGSLLWVFPLPTTSPSLQIQAWLEFPLN